MDLKYLQNNFLQKVEGYDYLSSPKHKSKTQSEDYQDMYFETPSKKSEKYQEYKSKKKDFSKKYRKIYSMTEGDFKSSQFTSPGDSKFNFASTQSTWISASTLQHSILNYTFSKDTRFKKRASVVQPISDNLEVRSTRNLRSAGLGKGRKNPFPGHTMRNAKEFPSPDKYYPDLTKISCHSKVKKEKDLGKTFGISRTYYENNYVENNPNQTMKQSQKIPGPGSYRVKTEPGSDKLKYSFYPKWKVQYNTDRVLNPGSGTYELRESLTTRSRFNAITQGKGERIDLAKGNQPHHFPGPDKYDLPSFTDKFRGKTRSYSRPKCTF